MVVYSARFMRTDRYLRRLLVVFVVVAVAALVVVIGRNRVARQSPTIHQSALPQGVDLALQQIHFSETQGATRKWELFAVSAAYDKAADVTRLEKIRFIVSPASALGPLTVTADRGEYHHATKDVRLVGHVRADGDKGFHFETGQVAYRASQSMLTTPDRISLVNGPLRVTGIGLELATETRQARFLQQVTAVIAPEKP